MELEISWEVESVSVEDQEKLAEIFREAIFQALLSGGGPEDAEIGLILVDDETIHLLNKSYRGVDHPTDVLSFAMQEKGEGEPEIFFGDLLESATDSQEENPQAEDGLDDAEKRADYSVEEIIEEEFNEEDESDDEEIRGLKLAEDFLEYEDSVLGDIVISVERARLQAEEYGHSFAREVVYLAVHGTFHLLGYNHDTDEDASVMRRMEERVMEKIGLPR